jgi:hypothetical protein
MRNSARTGIPAIYAERNMSYLGVLRPNIPWERTQNCRADGSLGQVRRAVVPQSSGPRQQDGRIPCQGPNSRRGPRCYWGSASPSRVGPYGRESPDRLVLSEGA